MKTVVKTLLTLFVFAAAALAVDTAYKTRLITTATLTINVREGKYITIRNFTQDKDVGLPRGAIVVGVPPPTPTPSPTPTPPTPTPTATPPPTPTPAPITATVLTAALLKSPPLEFVKPIIIAGPATLTIEPVPGATLAITYRKSLQPSQPTPTPTATSAPTATPTATLSASTTSSSGTTSSHSATVIESTVSDDEDTFSTSTPTATPTPTPSSQLPTPTPSITPTPLPTPMS
jgi:hypothetical protein